MSEEQESPIITFLHNLDERVLFIFLAIIVLIGFFLFEIFGQSNLTDIIRLIFIFFVLVLIYRLWPGAVDTQEEPIEIADETQPEIQNLIENSEEISFSAGDKKVDFYRELTQFFGNLIKMVRATFVSHSAIIFLVEKHSKKLRIEFCESQSTEIERGDLIETNGTLPGSVFLNHTSILEQNIPEEGQTVNYYQKLQKIKSFLAVPILINNDIRGVLAVDSLVALDFSEEDLELLKAYERLISQGIQLIGERERSHLVNQSLLAQKILLKELDDNLCYDNLYSALGASCRAVYQFDRLSVVTLDSENSDMGQIVKVIGQRDSMAEGFQFFLNDGIVGWVIRKNKPLILDDLEKGDLFRPRYSGNDKSNFGLRSFLGVPICFSNQVFGMISIESKQPDFYTDWDQNVLVLLAATMGLAFLSLRLLPPR